MLFLLKRDWRSALVGLAVLAALGLGLRSLVRDRPALALSLRSAEFGVAVFAAVLASDGLLHGLFWLTLGPRYRPRYRQLAAVFKGQTAAAMVAGAAMAGLGEELVFRGVSTNPLYLGGAALLFGLLHHAGRPLGLFTVWAAYQGLLFAAAVYLTRALAVTMLAHFLHDLAGFLVFRHVNRRGAPPQPLPPLPLSQSD